MGESALNFDLRVREHNNTLTVEVDSNDEIFQCRPIPISLRLAELPDHSNTISEWVRLAFDTWLNQKQPEHLYIQAQNVGEYLFEQLFVQDVRHKFETAVRFVSDHRQIYKYVRLRLGLPPTLAKIPWELLYYEKIGFLSTSPFIALIRIIDEVPHRQGFAISGQLNTVGVFARPSKWGINSEAVESCKRHLSILTDRQLASEPVFIEGPSTEERLRKALSKRIDILDITCHGMASESNHESVLLFENGFGKEHMIGAEYLAKRLADTVSRLRVVFLKACVSGFQPGQRFSSSIAHSILRNNSYSVIAMQFLIPVSAAEALSGAFYSELSDIGLVDRALQNARLKLQGLYNNTLDWAVPVLFLQTTDSVLFRVEQSNDIISNNNNQTARPEDRGPSQALLNYRARRDRQLLEEKLELTAVETPRKKTTAKDFARFANELYNYIPDAKSKRMQQDYIDEMRLDAIKYAKRAVELHAHVRYFELIAEIHAFERDYSFANFYCNEGIKVGPEDVILLKTKMQITEKWKTQLKRQLDTGGFIDEYEEEELKERLTKAERELQDTIQRMNQLEKKL